MLKQKYDALVLAAFGTSDIQEFNNTYMTIYHSISAVVDVPVIMRITSERIYKNLKNDFDVVFLDDVNAKLSGITPENVLYLPLLMADGNENSKLISLCQNGGTLMPTLLQDSCEEFSQYICKKYPQKAGTKYILLGHGSHESDEQFKKLSEYILAKGRNDIEIRLVHNQNGVTDFYTGEVIAAPLMICAGHHIKEIFEELQRRFLRSGVSFQLCNDGLGKDEEFSRLFVERLLKKSNEI